MKRVALKRWPQLSGGPPLLFVGLLGLSAAARAGGAPVRLTWNRAFAHPLTSNVKHGQEGTALSAQLFSPITLRDLTVRNRLWVPPMCQYSVDSLDGVAAPWHLVHYGAMAAGGAGGIIVEATAVQPEGRISPNDLGLWNDTQRDALVPVVDFVHSQGAAVGIQLAHAGRKGSTWPALSSSKSGSVPADSGGWETVAPSPVAFPGLAKPRELSRTEIAEVVTAFADSARRAKEAGFAFVEIHAAHGYLLHEFLSPLSNHRTDEYGGSLENRSRLVVEVLDAVRTEVGQEMPVLVRLSATDWTEGGLTVDETVQLITRLKERGADMIDVSSGGNAPAQIPAGPGYQVPFATQIREQTGIATAAVGMITEPYQAEQILLTEQADVVLVGREMLRDPHFPLRAAGELGVQLPYLPRQYHRAF